MLDLGQAIKKNSTLILTDIRNNILFQAKESPHSSLYKYIYSNKDNLTGEYFIYGNQIGTAVANMVDMINIKKIVAYKISEVGLEILKQKDIQLEYSEIIDLVKSSKNMNKVCSLEKRLLKLNKEQALKIMEEKYIKS